MYTQIQRAKKSLYNFEEQCVCGEGADSLTLAEIMTHYKVTVMKKTVWYNTKMDIKTNAEHKGRCPARLCIHLTCFCR